MQVVCPQCHAVCVVSDDQAATPDRAARCSGCGANLASTVEALQRAPGHELSWLALLPAGQVGPYNAAQMAQLLDEGGLDWGALVWRQGLKGWRPARRDPQLVTSAAAARGVSSWGDTQRVGGRRSILPAADTIVEPAPPQLAARSVRALTSSPTPNWRDTVEAPPAQPTSRPQEATLADAFRSAPSIVSALGAANAPHAGENTPVQQRPSTPHSWLPSPQSMMVVAIVAFASGVLAAALWGRLSPRAPRASTMVVRSSVPQAVVKPRSIQPSESAARPVAVTTLPAPPTQAHPTELELRREVKRVSPDVRRCVDDLTRGAELEIFFEGSSGRVHDVKLRTQRLTPGRVECITQAVRQMQVEPFSDARYRYWHKFSY